MFNLSIFRQSPVIDMYFLSVRMLYFSYIEINHDSFAKKPVNPFVRSLMRKRMDRFIEDALSEFTEWFVFSDWYGKERDCVNMFAHNFLASKIEPGPAISHLGQVRIESAVPQPKGFPKKTAAKDLVIWSTSYDTVWDNNWNISNFPKVVMEWKTKRSGNMPKQFDYHDVRWLSGFTEQYFDTFGYLVRVYDGPHGRSVDWAKVRDGTINATNLRT